jgi:hypothetical protein
MEKDEVLKMLFEEHHRQLSETREKIQTLTHRVVGVLTVATGWLILADQVPSGVLRWMLVGGVVLIALAACTTLFRYNRSYRTIARVVAKINLAFGLFETGRYLPDDSVYPDGWKMFGSEPLLSGIWHHLLIIVLVTAVCVIAALVR